MAEKWAGVIYNGESFGDYYEVSTEGRLRNAKTKKVVKTRVNSRGHIEYCGTIKGKYKAFKVHKAVAETFIPNPENKPHAIHKDGVKTNNIVDNLIWATSKELTKHVYDLGLINEETLERSHKKIRKPVLRIDNEGNIVEFESRLAAARSIANKNIEGVAGHISKCITGERKTCGGYRWREK